MSNVVPEPPLRAPTADPLAALNGRQREAVTHGISDGRPNGPLLVIAGAGSGKTNTLAHRVAHLVLHGADPQRILLLTFSRRASVEMQRRVGQVLQRALGTQGLAGQAAGALPWAGTFHGIGARLLRAYAHRIGLSESFTIHDRGDAEDLMGIVRHELGLSSTAQRFPLKSTCMGIYSRTLNSQASLADTLRTAYPWCAAWEAELQRLFKAYTEAKLSQHVLDYDDLLLLWADMMADDELAQEVGVRFDHVLVDEYQDTNRLQSHILQRLKPGGQGLTVVGDDAQAIYSFRAATVRNILDFPTQFAQGTQPARVVTLDRNYRSTQPILQASNAVIGLASERFTKDLWTERASSQKPQLVAVADEAEQARWIAERILVHREAGMKLTQQAVLFRTSHHSTAVELELARRNIPFVKFGGLRFLEAAHVKDLLSLLRWAHNPRSRLAGFRVAQLVPGIGPASAKRLLDAMAEAPDPLVALRAFKPPPAAKADWADFCAVYEALLPSQAAGDAGTWPADFDQAKRWYLPRLEQLYDDHAARRIDLDQLGQLTGGYPSRERFLTELTLDPPDATSAESGAPHRDEDYVILSTIHSAKGQEWKAVFALNVIDGCIPADLATGSREDIDEERRLLYVAMTRAKDHLHVMVPQRFYVTQQGSGGDRHVYGARTRFIPAGLEPLFELTASEAVARANEQPAVQPGKTIDLAARARSRWG